MAAWTFRRRKGLCAACERAFDDGEAHFSLLWIEGEELVRSELCRPCWQLGQAAREQALFWWRTRHEIAQRKGLALNLEAIELLFHRLANRAEQHLNELRYLLALILLRKRRLKLVRLARTEQGDAMVVRKPRHSDEQHVAVFDFDAARMDELRAELARLFDEGEGIQVGGPDTAAAAGDGPSSELGAQALDPQAAR
jgi:hypothetical protein